MCKYPIPVKGKLLARRACSFSLLRLSKEKVLSAHVCVRLLLINSDHQHSYAWVSRLVILF
jgi:hypothetical protein